MHLLHHEYPMQLLETAQEAASTITLPNPSLKLGNRISDDFINFEIYSKVKPSNLRNFKIKAVH